MIFNFSGLHAIFIEAIKRQEPTIIFPLANGRGQFLFLLFIPTNRNGKINWSKIELFIFLSRTQKMLCFDLTGNFYHKGVFKIALDGVDEQAFRVELGIEDAHHGNFFLSDFLSSLNAGIPSSLTLEEKIACMQSHREHIRTHCGHHIDSASKIYLLRAQPVPPPAKPREETLRKLYALSEDKAAIARLVDRLKQRNWTVAWTSAKPESNAFSAVWSRAFMER